MPLSLVHLLKSLITGFIAAFHFSYVAGAQTDSAPKSATLDVSDETIAVAKGDIQALYRVWIAPLSIAETPYILNISNEEALIQDGISRFCAANKGVLSDTKAAYVTIYRCNSATGTFMFHLRVQRIEGNKLWVTLDTPALIAARDAARVERTRSFEERKMVNGPTGWITTTEGRFKFLRIGTPKQRSVLEVTIDEIGVPIEKISRIEFKDSSADIAVTFRDGTTKTVNRGYLVQRWALNVTSTFGVDCGGLPIVVNTKNQGPQVQVFSSFEGLRLIEVDPNETRWKAVSGGAMAVPFDESKSCAAHVVGGEDRANHQQSTAKDETTSGSGFFVSASGHILTNDHVAGNCRRIGVRALGRSEMPATLLGRDKINDLALLQLNGSYKSFATFRAQPVNVGEKIYAFGFPLTGLLSSDGNASEGLISAVSGLDNDSRHLQISAPVQPGNSGGPVYDSFGRVVGVVVSKLNASAIMRATGDIPQNINFAIKQTVAATFLESHGVRVSRTSGGKSQDSVSIFSKARSETLFVRCSE